MWVPHPFAQQKGGINRHARSPLSPMPYDPSFIRVVRAIPWLRFVSAASYPSFGITIHRMMYSIPPVPATKTISSQMIRKAVTFQP